MVRIGLDIGSTTAKAVVMDEQDNILYKRYLRHVSLVEEKTIELLREIQSLFPALTHADIALSGSAGMGLAESCQIPFVQEVHATRVCSKRLTPHADVVIELGGEDAKIIFLEGMADARMNGSCAGGTGAFIDQMATLMNLTPEQLNDMAKEHERIYTIASRCGVFAKSDIQPLLNQGAQKNDIAASIFKAVVNQTIAGLAQGRKIEGHVLYLGGPLTFLSQLRESFDHSLGLKGICPQNSLYFVALGAAYSAGGQTLPVQTLIERLDANQHRQDFHFMKPLFENELQYEQFSQRHSKAHVERGDLERYRGDVFLGVDVGSTTVKFALIGQEGELLDTQYQSNSGNPVPLVREYLQRVYALVPDSTITASAVTGYGEELIRNAFNLDYGVVETIAHYTAAKRLMPEVDFILDIGGQDIKCLKIHHGVIDNIYLNEACSSGCGSFLQTFANALGYPIDAFARLGLLADKPVDLGSRCTVFMNSSVKQAQKDGASTANISAGLSISVIKNAIYKVIRPTSHDQLGQHIVVQGGTFQNDAVLRAFEQEIGQEVVRPQIAGLMGAYGVALYAKEEHEKHPVACGLLNQEQLENFTHQIKTANCTQCSNHCGLTINLFNDGHRYIGGNRCQMPLTQTRPDARMNLYRAKLHRIVHTQPHNDGRRKIGLPLGLNIYELHCFWTTFFETLGFDVVLSPFSDRQMYLDGQSTIPSDTVCFPAKLMHGHIRALIRQGVHTIFYPCMSYSIDHDTGDNCYNCPVVAYYPEVLNANMPDMAGIHFIHGFVGLHKKRSAAQKLWSILSPTYPDITLPEVRRAVKAAYQAYDDYLRHVAQDGEGIIALARSQHKPIVLLAGRPYHIDPEINHGIDNLITSMGMAVISEDAVFQQVAKQPVHVLNQWAYHSRLYAAARYTTLHDDMSFVQLVSFGCGCDAITTDECRRIIEDAGRIYTQIKIDEIENLGAVKIRLRSLFSAMGTGR